MKRILHIITGLTTGGAEMMLYRLLSKMDAKAFSSAVICLIESGTMVASIKALGIPVYTLDMPRGRVTPGGILRLIRLTRYTQPDLIQGWMYHGNLAAQFAGMFMHKPVVWNIRTSLDAGMPSRFHISRIGARFSGKPAGVIFNSATSAHLHQQMGYHPKQTFIIPNGFDGDVFHPDSAARAAVRRELNLADTTPLVGMMGRYIAVKDHPTFLKAAAQLVKNGSQAHFILAGRDVDSQNPELAALTTDLQLTEHIHLLGERRDMPRLMASLDVLVSTSHFEGFPNVVGEAMACGVPCVVTDVSDNAKIVGDTGLLFPPQDVDALSKALVEMLAMPPDGMHMRQHILTHYSLDHMVKQYENLYTQIIENKHIGK